MRFAHGCGTASQTLGRAVRFAHGCGTCFASRDGGCAAGVAARPLELIDGEKLTHLSSSRAVKSSSEPAPQTDKACTEVQAVGCLGEELRSRETGGIGRIAPGMMTGKRSDGR